MAVTPETQDLRDAATLAEACRELFARHTPAILTLDGDRSARAMLLSVPDGDGASYYVLSHDRSRGEHYYSLRRRRTTDAVDIAPDSGVIVPDVVADAVTHGVPIPRDGSLFGWERGDVITALVPIYATSTPASPDPFWAVMPYMDTPEEQWPPFTRRCFFGHWFWEHYWAGRIISLSDLIAGTPETVFWTKTKGIMDSDCCVVVRDIANSKGGTLRRGIYVLSEALLAGKPIPPLHTLISNADKTDLTTRFQHFLRDADPAHR